VYRLYCDKCVFGRQTNEIVNTAVLTGAVQSYPMTVYSISHAGHVADVTSQATCHAGDADILQVTSDTVQRGGVSECGEG